MATTKNANITADYDLVGKIMEYESGMLPKAEAIELFQRLINTGIAWQLQGHYGRTAMKLLDRGLCKGGMA